MKTVARFTFLWYNRKAKISATRKDEYYEEVRAMVKILNFVHEADVDDEIPPTSLVREFIGGNAFYR